MVSILDTVEYREWLANFPVQYQPTVELLVSALHYLDESTFRSDLTERILRDFASRAIMSPALVVPVRTGSEMGGNTAGPAVIFGNVWPRHPLPASNAGSEALCANIIRNLGKGQSAALGMIPVPRTLDDLRRRKVRSIVLVGDYAGSGDQAIEAAKIWTRNRTIRSWRSYGLITIHVILHSVSGVAKKALTRETSIDRLSMVGIAADFDSAAWTREQRKDIDDFCMRFARHRENDGLGWKRSAGLFVMQHIAPNNLPMVLRQMKGTSRRRDGWYPLFFQSLRIVALIRPSQPISAHRLRAGCKESPASDSGADLRSLEYIAGRLHTTTRGSYRWWVCRHARLPDRTLNHLAHQTGTDHGYLRDIIGRDISVHRARVRPSRLLRNGQALHPAGNRRAASDRVRVPRPLHDD
jgi:hypothetical protein